MSANKAKFFEEQINAQKPKPVRLSNHCILVAASHSPPPLFLWTCSRSRRRSSGRPARVRDALFLLPPPHNCRCKVFSVC